MGAMDVSLGNVGNPFHMQGGIGAQMPIVQNVGHRGPGAAMPPSSTPLGARHGSGAAVSPAASNPCPYGGSMGLTPPRRRRSASRDRAASRGRGIGRAGRPPQGMPQNMPQNEQDLEERFAVL